MKQISIKKYLQNYRGIILAETIVVIINIIIAFLYRLGLMDGRIHMLLICIDAFVFSKMTKHYRLKVLDIHFEKYKEEKLKMGLNASLKDFYREYEYYAGCWNSGVDKHCRNNIKYEDNNTKDFRHKSSICIFFFYFNSFGMAFLLSILHILYV